jgi:hypothetical protein
LFVCLYTHFLLLYQSSLSLLLFLY